MNDVLSVTFAALADPTRRSMLARLTRGEASVTELAAPFEASLPTISRHLTVLERAGLVAKTRDAQWRRCRLEPAPLADVDAWLATYRRFFDERFDRLADQLAAEQPRTAGRPERSPARSPARTNEETP